MPDSAEPSRMPSLPVRIVIAERWSSWSAIAESPLGLISYTAPFSPTPAYILPLASSQ
ncbi:MAG: hypothetical protein BWZ10_01080 [candidate division BRC1 bacterium ADurb.BinA364]|nr:MAG: hypothetical protein BWZ10_01080 [candidate division BRC1 bacterium ADurb.BinA364]